MEAQIANADTQTNVNAHSNKVPFRLTIEELLSIISSFSNLLNEETTALKEVDFEKVDTLQKQKKILAKQYEEAILSLSNRKDELLDLDIETRDKLKNTRTHFNRLLEINFNALEAAKDSNQRLVDYILNIAREAITTDNQINYSHMGRTATYESASTSLTIDEDI